MGEVIFRTFLQVNISPFLSENSLLNRLYISMLPLSLYYETHVIPSSKFLSLKSVVASLLATGNNKDSIVRIPYNEIEK